MARKFCSNHNRKKLSKCNYQEKKIASIKIANKNVRKLSKRGKLRKKDKKEWLQMKHQLLDDSYMSSSGTSRHEKVASDEETIPLDMIDDNDWSRWTNIGSKDRKTKKCEEGEVAEFEKTPRRFSYDYGLHYTNALLPIKTDDGRIVSREEICSVSIEDDLTVLSPNLDNAEHLNDSSVSSKCSQNDDNLSFGTNELASRQKILFDIKTRISHICAVILSEPESNVIKLKELLQYAHGERVNALAVATVQKLAIASLLEVFLDIIPDYRIREIDEKEINEGKLKKETKNLWNFEQILLRYYRKYLIYLERLTKPCFLQRKVKNSMKKLILLTVKCLCKLMNKHFYFNFGEDLIALVVQLAMCKDTSVCEICFASLQQLFQDDHRAEATLVAVRCFDQGMKKRKLFGNNLSLLLSTFLSLQIEEVDYNRKFALKSEKSNKKLKLQPQSRKEKKYSKQMLMLEKELLEVSANENREYILKTNTQIMTHLFAVYFRILKQTSSDSLLIVVLKGLIKFIHLIDINFYDDLLSSLHGVIISGSHKLDTRLHCIYTVFMILAGEGETLNIDGQRFYRCLYSLMPKLLDKRSINDKSFIERFKLLLQCLRIMFLKKSAACTVSRTGAFVKRLCAFSLPLPDDMLILSLSIIKEFFTFYPGIGFLLDDENIASSCAYLGNLDDPDCCGVQNTSILPELSKLKCHQNENIYRLAKTIINDTKH